MKHINNLTIKQRKTFRETVTKVICNKKQQNALFSELYLLPNEIAIKKAEEVLKGRISIDEFVQCLDMTTKRYKKILNLSLKLKEDG